MSEETTGKVSFPSGPGQVQGQPSAQPEAGNQTAPQYLTKADLEAFEQRMLQQVQSRTDKAESRIDKKIRGQLQQLNQTIDLQRKAGIEISDEQAAKLRQTIYDQAYLQDDAPAPSPAPAAPVAAQPPAQELGKTDPLAEFVNARIDKILAKHGVTISQEEAKAAGLDKIADPGEFLDRLEELAAQKKTNGAVSPAARIPSIGAGAATNLQAQYDAEKAKIPRGSAAAKELVELKIRYRKLGLNV